MDVRNRQPRSAVAPVRAVPGCRRTPESREPRVGHCASSAYVHAPTSRAPLHSKSTRK